MSLISSKRSCLSFSLKYNYFNYILIIKNIRLILNQLLFTNLKILLHFIKFRFIELLLPFLMTLLHLIYYHKFITNQEFFILIIILFIINQISLFIILITAYEFGLMDYLFLLALMKIEFIFNNFITKSRFISFFPFLIKYVVL